MRKPMTNSTWKGRKRGRKKGEGREGKVSTMMQSWRRGREKGERKKKKKARYIPWRIPCGHSRGYIGRGGGIKEKGGGWSI